MVRFHSNPARNLYAASAYAGASSRSVAGSYVFGTTAALFLFASWSAWWLQTLDLSARVLSTMTFTPTLMDAEQRLCNALAWMREANTNPWHRKQAEKALERYFRTLEQIMEREDNRRSNNADGTSFHNP